jgi:hypothetical protein
MRVILIDPFKREVKHVDMSGDNLQEFYRIIECSAVEVPVSWDDGDSLWIDEEGWFKDYPEGRAGFEMEGWAYAIIGKAVITGVDAEGETTSPKQNDPLYWRDQINWRDDSHMTRQGSEMGLI